MGLKQWERVRSGELAFYRPNDKVYIPLLDLCFNWYPKEIDRVKVYWKAGASLETIAKALQRDMDEVAILLIDLARHDRIKERPGGVYGEEVANG